MRLLYIVPNWPGAYTTYMYNELAWMQRRGHALSVVALRRDVGGEAQLEEFGLAGLPVLQTDTGAGSAEAALPAALAFATAQRAELILAEGARAESDLARRMSLASGRPYGMRMHGGDVHSNPWPNLQTLVDDAAVVCPVSPYLAEIAAGTRRLDPTPAVLPLRLDPARLRVTCHGLPDAWFADAPAPQPEGDPVIGTVGRLSPIKRHEDLLEAAARLRDEHPRLRVRVVGGGQNWDALHALAQRLGLQDQVEFLGPRTWAGLRSVLDGLHVYVAASQLESFCLATLEATARGLPLLATRTGIHEKIVEPDVNGQLYDAGDLDALCAHLRALLAAGPAARRQMGQRSLDLARSSFHVDDHLSRSEAIYRAVLAGRPLPPGYSPQEAPR